MSWYVKAQSEIMFFGEEPPEDLVGDSISEVLDDTHHNLCEGIAKKSILRICNRLKSVGAPEPTEPGSVARRWMEGMVSAHVDKSGVNTDLVQLEDELFVACAVSCWSNNAVSQAYNRLGPSLTRVLIPLIEDGTSVGIIRMCQTIKFLNGFFEGPMK